MAVVFRFGFGGVHIRSRVLLGLSLAIGLTAPAQAVVLSNVWAGTWVDDPNNINPPPSTIDAYIRQPIEDGDAIESENATGIDGLPYDLNLGNKIFEVKTLRVSNVAARLNSQGGTTTVLNLSNTHYAAPSLIVGDSTGGGYASFKVDENTRLQSFGFANIGSPTAPGLIAEGAMHIAEGADWFHDGLINIGEGGGAGLLLIRGEVSGGMSRPHPNVFVDNGQVSRGNTWAVENKDWRSQLIVSDTGSLFARELTIEGGVKAWGEVNADLVQIRNGGNGAFSDLQTAQLQIGDEGAGQASFSGTADLVSVGRNAGGDGTIDFGGATVGSAANDYYIPALELALNGGTALARVNGNDVVVNGSTRMADFGGTAALQVTGGGTFTATGQINAASDPDYSGAGGSNGAGLLVEGAGSTLTAHELYLAANGNTPFYGSLGPGAAGTGSLTVRDGGRVAITGRTEVLTFDTPWGPQTYTYYYAGQLIAGADSVISGDGTISLTNPDPASDGRGLLRSFGTISPGNSPGWLTIDGNLSLAGVWGGPGARLRIELGGTQAGIDYDVLEVLGDLDVTGAILELALWGDFDPSGFTAFDFLRVHGALSGRFGELVDYTGWGLTLDDLTFDAGGIRLAYDPSGGSPVPAPLSLLLWGSALLGCCWRPRRRRLRE